MKRLLTTLALAALLFNSVNSVSIKDEDLEIADQFIVFGGETFLKFLDNVKMQAVTVLKKKGFQRTGNEVQDLWKDLKELTDRTIAKERAKGNKDDFIVATHIFHNLGIMYADGVLEFFRSTPANGGVMQGIIKKKTMVKLWRDVGSLYFPEAPPIQSDPFWFPRYFLSKIVMNPYMVRTLKVGSEVVKIDINQLGEGAQVAFGLVMEKASEIYSLESQTESNEFAVTLRTVSGILSFYWDAFLEYTETISSHIGSLRKSTTCHSKTKALRTGHLIEKGLTIYKNLCENGYRISEVENLLIYAKDVLTALGGEDIIHMLRGMIYELWIVFDAFLSKTKISYTTSEVEGLKNRMRHLHTIKDLFFEMWDSLFAEMTKDHIQEFSRHWDEVKNIFIKELIDSGELTQENLDQAHNSWMNINQLVFEKYVKMIDGLDERINVSTKSLESAMQRIFLGTNNLLIKALEILLSD